MSTAAAVWLALVAAYLLSGAVLAVLTTDRPRKAFPARDSLLIASVRLVLALGVMAAAVWVILS